MTKQNYDDFAQTFSQSRNNMKWEEIEYFIEKYSSEINEKKIIDIGCGNGRLLEHFIHNQKITDIDYFGIDASKGMIEEAKKKYSTDDFIVCDMMNMETLKEKNYEGAFFIASFHHLETLEERENVLQTLKNLIIPGSYIFMTNWALNSELNNKKYEDSLIKSTKNQFGNSDYSIKIGNFERFYHCFSIEELECIFQKTGFEIIENRLFENQKNFISIIKSPVKEK